MRNAHINVQLYFFVIYLNIIAFLLDFLFVFGIVEFSNIKRRINVWKLIIALLVKK